jgi:hypothetical protein
MLGNKYIKFCEDNSQPMINKRNDCPSGTICSSTQLNQISFDMCGDILIN